MSKNVVIYATCQGTSLAQVLTDTPSFVERFSFPYIIINATYIRQRRSITEDMVNLSQLKDADVFIYQPIDNIHGNNSSDYLMQFLKPICVKISIPYVYNDSLWPFIHAKRGDITDNWFEDIDTPLLKYTEPIKELITSRIAKDDILTLFDRNEIDWNFKSRHEILMGYLRNKEKNMDVKVVDYIEENLSLKRLFMYYSHPSAEVIVYMANKILQLLEISPNNTVYPEDFFFSERYLFPTSSVNYFNLKFVSDEERTIADKYYKDIIIELFYGKI